MGLQGRVVRTLAAVAVGAALAIAGCGGSSTHLEQSGGSSGTSPDGPSAGTGGTAAGGAPSEAGDIGEPCVTAAECGAGLNCTLGVCRTDCRTDADCPRGVLCSGTTRPFGCSLAAELECESAGDCPEPLVCGADGKCRVGCEVADDCPRNDHTCRTGVCVGNDDPDERWFECVDGETVCENYLTDVNCYEANFPESCYRRMGCRLDGMNWGLVETCSPGYCTYTFDAGGQFSAECQ